MPRRQRRILAPFAFTAALVTTAHAGPGRAPILGGTQATVGQFPSVVALEVGGGLCTGTLITPEWVLTAAHCISPGVVGGTQASITSSVRVHFATVNIRTSPGTVVRASATIPDPTFDVNNLGSDDIGLIKLATPVTDVTPVPVNLQASKAPVGIGVTMVGFGATAVGGGGSVGIEYVVEQTSVSCAGGGGSDADLLCFSQGNGRGKCEGDSGGPSFAMIDGKPVQVGITSFGDQDCAQFGADTRTDAERAFLVEHIPALQCQADGSCTAACGSNGLPVDPDCPVCDTDGECGDAQVCFEHACIIEPFGPRGVGSECTDGTQCESGSCAAGPGGDTRCTLTCTPGTAAACPAALECLEVAGGAGGGACWPADGGGCCDASGRGAPTALAGGLLLGLLLRRRRARPAA